MIHLQSKSKQKRVIYNEDVIKALKDKYGFTTNYIRMSIRGDRTGTIPLQIQEEYKKAAAEAKKAAEKRINEM